MTNLISSGQNTGIAFTRTSVSSPPPSGKTAAAQTKDIEERTGTAASRAISSTIEESAAISDSATHTIRAEPISILAHDHVTAKPATLPEAPILDQPPGTLRGAAIAIAQPLATGHIDERLFAKQTGETTRNRKGLFETISSPFANGKLALNILKGLGKYGVLYTVVDWVRPRIERVLPDDVPYKSTGATIGTGAVAGVAETIVTAPLSVFVAAKRSDGNAGVQTRSCKQIIQGVPKGQRLRHFLPVELVKWNGARNIAFAIPFFTAVTPIREAMERSLGFTEGTKPTGFAKMALESAATGIASSAAATVSFGIDTIASRCTKTPGLVGSKEFMRLLQEKKVMGTILELNRGLPLAIFRMGVVGLVAGGVTSALGMAYVPTKEAFREGMESTRKSIAAFNPRSDLIADSPAEARRLGGAMPEEERPSTSIADFVAESPSEALALGGPSSPEKEASGFFSSARSFFSSLLTQSSTAASSQALSGELPDGIEWTSSGDYADQASSSVTETPAETSTVSADTDEGLLFSEGWVPPTGNRASEEASTQPTPSPAADEQRASSGGSWIDYASGPSFL